MNDCHQNSPFTSLKWRIALTTAAVLFLIHGLFSGFAIYSLQQQFRLQRQEALHQHRLILDHLTEQSYQLLQQIAESIALVAENRPAATDTIADTIDNYWTTYQLTWGIEAVHYFDSEGCLLRAWGTKHEPPYPLEEIEPVLASERPQLFFHCARTCLQYAAVPIIGPDETTRVLVIGRSLANLILDFHRLTRSHIAILEQHSDAPPRIVAVTQPDRNMARLQRLPLDTLQKTAEEETLVDLENATLALHLVHPDTGRQLAFLILDDITETLSAQRRSLTNYLLGTVLSLLAGITIVSLLLRRPLARLEKATATLPLLAEGRHEEIQRQLTQNDLPHRDEIAILEANILQASARLASLQQQVDERTRSLVQQTRTLQQERNFVQGLLDTAPLIILTQDQNGSIITVNRFARRFLAGCRLQAASFDRLFLRQEYERLQYLPLLAQLRKGEIARAHFDTQLPRQEQTHHITWFHTRLGDSGSETPLILSIGLDITERKNAERRLSWLADHDPLTHLNNRRAFQSKLAALLDRATLERKPFALLYFDLDQFKYVNDTCGHKTGDALLQIIANKLREVTRSEDILARLGGDEFALVVYDSNRDTAVHIAEKVFSALQAVDCQINGQPFKVTVSIGIALFPEHGRTLQDLLANADLAMYQAKEAGRSRIHVYTPDTEFHKRIQQQLYWKDQIEQALEEDRFVLYFQPILDIRRGTVSHYETLLRMIDPDGQVLAPGLFIPMAEQLGLIQRLDRMVVDMALDVHRRLLAEGNPLTLSVNLSGHSMADEALQSHLQECLSANGVDANRLIFEITETAAVSNFASAQRLIKKIKDLGCHFALDDFGVGFSSFYYLMHLPVDYVKIDGSFVKNLENNLEDQTLVSALADIAKRLGKKTVAEFVENEAILEYLREIGVDYAQGYHIGRPAPTITALPQSSAGR
ncbi:hypothetical protein MIN45_P1944 [Methylomarinovum tepidoasis]|uniref:Uncharacterized protein n=1 Tax=Methylomarinovum tepidoasis TaxID=2840183 RepID=A0AAU9CJJ8_9GAMM|nr:EAL domain-containing protein [Methylomarinovum sp. IN45]BCX89571.1 hypothetical protein MIN45_P1944 [Methylomarinovum sp. IN45]